MLTEEILERPQMHYWDAFWDHRPAECPCDEHFIAWLDDARIRDAAIYHFGTGGHHYVGIECAHPERRNSVLGITAAPKEHETFVALAIKRPDVLRYYNAVFGDIYLLNGALLPEFDVVTLFHLCEFRGPQNDAYGGLTDLQVAEMLADKLKPGGTLAVYPGSFAWDNARPLIEKLVASRHLEPAGTFRSIVLYRKPA